MSSEETTVKKILGIDFGKSKVGLALADDETRMAFAFKTLENDKSFKEKLIDIVKNEDVGQAIIGIPGYKKGETIEKEAKDLGDYLTKVSGIEVTYHEEMFTTKMAQDNLKDAGLKNLSRSDDRESARIILQDWLDNN